MTDFSNIKLKPASQNVDVHFFQTRNPGEWKARVVVSKKEVHMFGPCDMRALLVNVDKFLILESTYTDILVHGDEAMAVRNKPKKMSEIRGEAAARLRANSEASD